MCTPLKEDKGREYAMVNTLDLTNGLVSLQFQKPGYALTLIENHVQRRTYRFTVSDLYSMELTSPTGEKRIIGTSDAVNVDSKLEKNHLTLEFTHQTNVLSTSSITVICRIALNGDNQESEWTFEVRNRSEYAIQKVFYPLVVLEKDIKTEEVPTSSPYRNSFDWNVEYKSALLLGLLDGELIPEPFENIPDGFGWWEEHPGRMSIQLAAYIDTKGGLCLYTKDGVGYPKILGFKREGTTLDITPSHLFPREFGADIQLDYAVALAPCTGDWTAAADLYKTWAETQTWTRTRLIERQDVPDWVRTGYPFLLYFHQRPGVADHSDTYEETLPHQMLPVLKAYGTLLDSEFCAVVFGWEKHCSWITPDVFPPYPNEQEFHNLVSGLQEDGNRVFLYTSGTRWAVKNPRDPAWDGTEYWEKEGRSASCISEDGEWAFDSRPWAINHKLCISANGTRKMLDGYREGFLALNLDAIQYDQNMGGESYVCYSQDHGHPPGYGRWMYDDSKQLLDDFLDECRKQNPEFSTSVEEPCEVLIPNLTFYDSRTQVYHGWPLLTNMPCVGVPLFSYLYHEYAVGFAGDLGIFLDGPESELVKLGRIISSGYLIMVYLTSDYYGYQTVKEALQTGQPIPAHLPSALRLLKNASAAIRTYAHEFHVLGQMRPSPQYGVEECFTLRKVKAQSYYNDDQVEYVDPESAYVKVPAVLCSAWLSSEGVSALSFVNISEKTQRISINMESFGVEWKNGPNWQLHLTNLDGTKQIPAPSKPDEFLRLELPPLQISILQLDLKSETHRIES